MGFVFWQYMHVKLVFSWVENVYLICLPMGSIVFIGNSTSYMFWGQWRIDIMVRNDPSFLLGPKNGFSRWAPHLMCRNLGWN